MKAPKLIRDWCKEADVDLASFVHEFDPNIWEEVEENLVGEDKYSNINEMVVEHLPSGRFFRVLTRSLPYGIEDYGMEEEEDDIEEVFPVRVTVTKYLTRAERRAEAAPPTNG
jgi:hypothetical protein